MWLSWVPVAHHLLRLQIVSKGCGLLWRCDWEGVSLRVRSLWLLDWGPSALWFLAMDFHWFLAPRATPMGSSENCSWVPMESVNQGMGEWVSTRWGPSVCGLTPEETAHHLYHIEFMRSHKAQPPQGRRSHKVWTPGVRGFGGILETTYHGFAGSSM